MPSGRRRGRDGVSRELRQDEGGRWPGRGGRTGPAEVRQGLTAVPGRPAWGWQRAWPLGRTCPVQPGGPPGSPQSRKEQPQEQPRPPAARTEGTRDGRPSGASSVQQSVALCPEALESPEKDSRAPLSC